jgi:hypothetical protein
VSTGVLSPFRSWSERPLRQLALSFAPSASVSNSDQTPNRLPPYADSDVKETRTDSLKGHTPGSSGGVPISVATPHLFEKGAVHE